MLNTVDGAVTQWEWLLENSSTEDGEEHRKGYVGIPGVVWEAITGTKEGQWDQKAGKKREFFSLNLCSIPLRHNRKREEVKTPLGKLAFDQLCDLGKSSEFHSSPIPHERSFSLPTAESL